PLAHRATAGMGRRPGPGAAVSLHARLPGRAPDRSLRQRGRHRSRPRAPVAVGRRDRVGRPRGLAPGRPPLRGVRRLIVTTLGRYLRLLGVQLRASFLTSLQYRADFLVDGAMSLYWIAWNLVPLLVLFDERPTVAGWDFPSALLVIAWFTI